MPVDDRQPESHSGDRDAISVREVLQALNRYRWLGLFVFILCMTAVVVYTYQSPSLYRAISSVLVESNTKNVFSGESEERSASVSQDLTKVQKALAESRPVILRALAISGLNREECATIMKGSLELPGNFAAHIDGQLLYLEVLDPTPKQSVLLANSWAQAFVETMVNRSKDPSKFAKEFLEKNIPAYQKDWIAKQNALNKFELETRFDPAEFDKHPLRKRVEDLSIKLNALNMECANFEAEQDVVSRPNVGVEDLIRLARARTDVALMGVLKQLEDRKSKQMDAIEKFKRESLDVKSIQENIDSIKAEIKPSTDRILAGIKLDLERAKAERQKVQLLFNSADQEFEVIKTNAARHRVLSSEAAMAERLYSDLAQRKSVNDLSGRYDYSYATQWEQAEVQEKPYKPRWLINLAVGFAFSFAAAFAAMYLASELDVALRTSREMEQLLHVPVVGTVPHARCFWGTVDSFNLIAGKSAGPAIKALHNVVLGIDLNHDSSQPLVITVTSPAPQDGKSFVASALAGLFAAQGRRVLLVDAAQGKRSLTVALKHESKAGLFDVLGGMDWAGDIPQAGVLPGLKFLPSGQSSSSQYASMTVDHVRTCVQRLRKEYDVVVFDAPPILAFSEAALFAQCSDVTILLARSRKTLPSQIERAAALLQSARVDAIHCVVNDVRSSDAARDIPRDNSYMTTRPDHRGLLQKVPKDQAKDPRKEDGNIARRAGGNAASSGPV
ncbi:MAG: AAA family ATPase [Planctomycetota bacterium]